MLFSSLLFLFRFIPVVFLVYYILPFRYKNFWLLLSSLFFYAWGEPKYFPIMLSSILVNYVAALLLERFRERKNLRRGVFIVSLIFTVGWLLLFKYTDFFIQNINAVTGLAIPPFLSGPGGKVMLPLGISFYTFQILSYTIDVYRGKVKAEHNFVNFGTFVTLFPQLIAGPIVKYTDINEELHTRTVTPQMLGDGVRLFIMGLGSKVLLANNVGALWDTVTRLGYAEVSTPLAWLGLIAYSFQIYFDFSGYSLMAIGLGKCLGFNFPQNFNYPYISKSVTEFWRRWHMTLGSWFREYVYIPLGGNRVGRVRLYLNLFVVWFLTGFWHGANWNFIFWGLYFLVLLVIEKTFLLRRLERSRVLSRCYLLFAVVISWALFAVSDLGSLGALFGRLFSLHGGEDWVYYLRNYGVTLLLCAFFSTPLLKKWYERIKDRRWLITAGLAAVMSLCVGYLVDATYNPFLYFNF
ncbi:MBOAT family O-acyltransferase [Harryflintia acetispora]|uniref:MBOAT family O-acyltransferase n=1 Tax=Harryflintia acetispora TaxID=1849041 RepID=UPI001896FA73|nr:MBOAT family protein [Harryflintia acetispora]